MKSMKKILTTALLLGALASCGGNTTTDETSSNVETPSEQPSDEVSLRELDAKLVNVAKDKKCYLTTTGQADLDTVNNLFKLSGTSSLIEKNALLNAADVEEGAVVFLTLGNSGKGLGAAGIDKASEKTRAEAFAAAAKQGKITLVLFHVGGIQRRGESDEIIEVAFNGADACFITSDGNPDGFFDTLASTNNVDFYPTESLFDMVDYVKGMFGK